MYAICTNIILLLFRLFVPTATVALTGYIDYQPSTGLPVVLTAPHGGVLKPTDVPDRDAGCWDGVECVWTHDCGKTDPERCDAVTTMDLYTAQLTQELRGELCRRCGKCPATVINLLSRIKLDANRAVDEATFGIPSMVQAYNEYHNDIKSEIQKIGEGKRGLLLDIHGHGHTLQRAELGYLLTAAQLNSIANITLANNTCINGLYKSVGGSFDALLRGKLSFGGILETMGFESVPSPTNPGPGTAPYFTGGYTVYTHGSLKGGRMDAIQIESPKSFRDDSLRTKYVQALASTVVKYLNSYYDISGCVL